MLREAAYLGIPAYSIFQSSIGQVDRYLESIGRITTIATADDFERLQIAHATRGRPLNLNPNLLGELTAQIVDHARAPRVVPVAS